MTKVRCEFTNYTNNKRCKHKFVMTQGNSLLHKYNNKHYCLQHINNININDVKLGFKYKNAALLIQKNYRGYKIRKILKNVYKKLPCDIQSYIINKYVREEYYNKKFNKSLEKVINNKLSKEIDIIDGCLQVSHENFINYISDNDKKIINYYYLCNKYKKLINEENFMDMKKIINKFRYCIRIFYSEFYITNYINNEIFRYYFKLKNIYYKCEAYLYPYSL